MLASDIRTRCKGRMRGHELTDPLWLEHINQAYKHFLSEAPFYMEETIGTAATVSGTRFVALPSNVYNVITVRNSTLGEKLHPIEGWSKMWTLYPDLTVTAPPVHYRPIGTQLHLFPVPGAVYTIEFVYHQEPADLTAADTPILPLRYQYALVDGALALAYVDDDRPEEAERYSALFNAAIKQAVTEASTPRGERYPTIHDDYFDKG